MVKVLILIDELFADLHHQMQEILKKKLFRVEKINTKLRKAKKDKHGAKIQQVYKTNTVV